MLLQSDVLGFPMVSIPEANLSVSLLPVTKFQFERFIAQENPYSDSWYEQVLAINPRCSWRKIDAGNREQLFMTGVLPSEALDFASWMGDGFDLPHFWEWRQILHVMTRSSLDTNPSQTLNGHAAASAIIDSLVAQIKPKNWAELSLLKAGVMEWVRNGERFGGFGMPREEFFQLLFNPEINKPILPLPGPRSRYFGFRLVYRGQLAHRGMS